MSEKIYVRTVLGFMVLLLIVIYGLVWVLPEEYYMDYEYPFWMEQKSYVTENGNQEEILLLGDSRIKMALLASELSSNTYNLALGGATSIEMYYTLKNYMEHHPKPKLIFVAFAPQHYQEAECYLVRTQQYHYFDDATFDDINQVIKKNGGKDYVTETLSYRYRSLEVYMKPVLKSIIWPRQEENMELYKKAREHKGRLFPPDNHENKSMKQIYPGELCYDTFKCAEYLNFYMEKLIELCLEENISIYIEQMPMGNPGYHMLLEQGYIEGYEKYMKFLYDKYNIPVNYQIPVYPPEDFCDDSHLNEKGARKFTKEFKGKYGFIFYAE